MATGCDEIMKREMKTPDDVCKAYADRNVQLTISTRDDGVVVVEGDKIALEFLGHLILRQARFGKDCGLQIGPKMAGRSFFAKESPFGVYVHRIQCKHSNTTRKKD